MRKENFFREDAQNHGGKGKIILPYDQDFEDFRIWGLRDIEFILSIMRVRKLIFFGLISLLISCGPVLRPTGVVYEDYSISGTLPRDSMLVKLMQPYRDSVASTMEEVIGQVGDRLLKQQPDCGLGNFMADALREMGSKKYGVTIDLAFVNYGGIRLNELTPGPITRGKVFELMPFDNILLLQKVDGKTLKSFFDLIASRNGWPLSGGSFGIRDGRAVDIKIGGKPLDESATYIVANSDFVINGGDNVVMFKSIPVQNIGYLMREAIMDHVRGLTAKGQSIQSPETRVYNAR